MFSIVIGTVVSRLKMGCGLRFSCVLVKSSAKTFGVVAIVTKGRHAIAVNAADSFEKDIVMYAVYEEKLC